MYHSRLVPRIIPTIGLVGAPILLALFGATLFGAYEQASGAALVAYQSPSQGPAPPASAGGAGAGGLARVARRRVDSRVVFGG